jgi:F-type H+-transporting ATPase subunit epsilon
MVTLEVVTAEAIKFKGEATQVTVPGVMGEMGILSSHAPLVSMLEPGLVKIFQPSGQNLHYVVSQGFVTVEGNKVVCLVDAALTAAEVDVEKTKARLEEIRTELAASPSHLERNRNEMKYLQSQLALVGAV